jgi:nitrate reductase gamma subunit
MNALHLLLWVALPYIAITVFIAGHIWRYRTDQYGWTTRSTQLLESRQLKWGSVSFTTALWPPSAGRPFILYRRRWSPAKQR